MTNSVQIRPLAARVFANTCTAALIACPFFPAFTSAGTSDNGNAYSVVEQIGSVSTPSAIAQQHFDNIRYAQQELQRLRDELEQRLADGHNSDSPTAKAARYWHKLTQDFEQELRNLDERYQDIRNQDLQDHAQSVGDELPRLERNYLTLLHNFEAAQYLFDATRSARKAKMDFMMYRMMKHVHSHGPEAQRAEQLFNQAGTSLEAGDLSDALDTYKAAAKAYNVTAFTEVLEGFASAGDSANRRAAERLADIRQEVAELLEDAFISIPAGEFMMGNSNGSEDEKPVRKVAVAEFKLGKSEIPFRLWDLCVEVRTCSYNPYDEQWGRGARPVINVSYYDVTQQFIPWLSLMTGKRYRLPSEAEWEYAARTPLNPGVPYSWGEEINCTHARYDGGFSSDCPAQTQGKPQGTATVMTFAADSRGLYDMHGNVWEWVEDCYSNSYIDAPADGRAAASENCAVGVLRGGAWDSKKHSLTTSNRFYFPRDARKNNIGFRLVEVNE